LYESPDSAHPKAMSKLSKEAKKRLLIVAAYIITTIAITLLLLPWIRQLSTSDGRIVMKQRVESYGAFAPMIYILLHVFHVIIAFVPEEKIKNHRLLQDENKLEWAVFLLFFIPGTPKDLLTYLVPLTRINPTRYLLIATLARIPSILSSAYIGSSFGQGKYLVSLVAFGITGGIGLIGMLINKHIERKK